MKKLDFSPLLLLTLLLLFGCGGGSTGSGPVYPCTAGYCTSDASGGQYGTSRTHEELIQSSNIPDVIYTLDPVSGPTCTNTTYITRLQYGEEEDYRFFITCDWYCANYQGRKSIPVSLTFLSPNSADYYQTDVWKFQNDNQVNWAGNLTYSQSPYSCDSLKANANNSTEEDENPPESI